MERMYQVGEFAGLTGVSVRTLHHYDRIGLLRPSARSEAGYRLYSERDLLQLQQILTLRYLGFSLRQIHSLLGRPDFDLLVSLRIQRQALHDRITDLERIDAALNDLMSYRLASGRWAWDLAARAATAVHDTLAKGDDTMSEYYTPEHIHRQFEELGKQVPRDEIVAVEQGWQSLLEEVRAGREQGLDPASPQADALLRRWDELTEAAIGRFRGNEELSTWVAEGYQTGRYQHMPGAPTPEDFAFMQRIRESQRA